MRRLVALLGVLALLRAWLTRRRARPAVGAGDSRADELRRRLQESRALAHEREEFEAGETPIDRAEAPEERRRDVHERGRAAIDEMRGPGEEE